MWRRKKVEEKYNVEWKEFWSVVVVIGAGLGWRYFVVKVVG